MIIFSSIYDVLWRKYDVYNVTVNPFTGNGGNLPQGRFICKISPTSKLNVKVVFGDIALNNLGLGDK